MITEEQALALFEGANPVPVVDDVQLPVGDARDLPTLQKRRNTMAVVEKERTEERQGRPRRLAMAAAAAVVAVIAAAIAVSVARSNEDTTIVDAPPEPTVEDQGTVVEVPPVTATPAPPTGEEAVDVATAYLAALEAGDTEAALALSGGETSLSDSLQSVPKDAEEYAAVVAFDAANKVRREGLSCADAGGADEATTVVCTMLTSWAPEQAANTGGIETTATFVVAADGIREIFYEYGFPDYRTAGDALMAWIETQHPAEADYEWYPKREIPSATEAALRGANRLRYGAEWAEFGVEKVESAFAAYRDGDLEAFMAAFATPAFGDTDTDADLIAAYSAAGVPLSLSDCVPAGVGANALRIRCRFATTDIAAGLSGIALVGTTSMLVQPDGLIINRTDDLPRDDELAFNREFRTWLTTEHPEVAGGVDWVEDVPSAPNIDGLLPFYEEFVGASADWPAS